MDPNFQLVYGPGLGRACECAGLGRAGPGLDRPVANTDHCRYTNRFWAFNHVRYLSPHPNGVSKSLIVPPFFLPHSIVMFHP